MPNFVKAKLDIYEIMFITLTQNHAKLSCYEQTLVKFSDSKTLGNLGLC